MISGDFFGIKDIKEVEDFLIGKSPNELEYFDISEYIDKMTFEEFQELIK